MGKMNTPQSNKKKNRHKINVNPENTNPGGGETLSIQELSKFVLVS